MQGLILLKFVHFTCKCPKLESELNNSVSLPEVMYTQSLWVGNLAGLHKSVFIYVAYFCLGKMLLYWSVDQYDNNMQKCWHVVNCPIKGNITKHYLQQSIFFSGGEIPQGLHSSVLVFDRNISNENSDWRLTRQVSLSRGGCKGL